MRYARILSYAAGGVWAIEAAKAETILGFLLAKAVGDSEQPRLADEDEGRRRRHAAESRGQGNGGVAVVPLYGIISPRVHDVQDISSPGGASAEAFVQAIRQNASDPQVGGIVIDVDSPGGNVLGIQEAAAAIRDAREAKPVVAVANHWAASAAYWLASAADEVVITQSGEVGSIGVYSYHEDVSKRLELLGVKPSLVKAGPFKAEGHPAFPLTDEAVAYIQARVDDSYNAFVRDVAKGRNVSRETVRESFGGGRMVGAQEAVKLGMADRVDSLENTIARVQRMGRKPSGGSRSDDIASRRRRLAVT